MENSSLGRIVGVLFSPKKTFEALRETPKWLVVCVLALFVGCVVAVVATQHIDWERSFAESGRQIPAEQMERQLDFMEQYGQYFAVGQTFIIYPILFLLSALLFWVGMRLSGAELAFKQSFATTLYGLVPLFIVLPLISLPGLMRGGMFTQTEMQNGSVFPSSLGYFAGEDAGAIAKALMSSVDVFSIWSIALLIIGFATVGRSSTGKSTGVVLAVWILGVAVKVAMTALFT